MIGRRCLPHIKKGPPWRGVYECKKRRLLHIKSTGRQDVYMRELHPAFCTYNANNINHDVPRIAKWDSPGCTTDILRSAVPMSLGYTGDFLGKEEGAIWDVPRGFIPGFNQRKLLGLQRSPRIRVLNDCLPRPPVNTQGPTPRAQRENLKQGPRDPNQRKKISFYINKNYYNCRKNSFTYLEKKRPTSPKPDTLKHLPIHLQDYNNPQGNPPIITNCFHFIVINTNNNFINSHNNYWEPLHLITKIRKLYSKIEENSNLLLVVKNY
ncbi:hypothetical protein NQ317_004915 [Molorchus minor]|uniref:Uncharacterized protein n=1 Tax=Molorchus minor TaxID=1323400 RepID=A0ABQ9JJZ0_9CUCU|nr:hypothetical protein NQ317_004915 [Molorchus minor]